MDADAAVVEPMVTDKTAEAAATHPREHGNLAAGVTILTPMAIFVWVIISILLTTMCTTTWICRPRKSLVRSGPISRAAPTGSACNGRQQCDQPRSR